MTHKAREGGVVLDLDDAVRRAIARRHATQVARADPSSSSGWRPRGTEVLVAIRRDGLIPVLVVGAGGVHTERLDDVAVVPLPADEARIAAGDRNAPHADPTGADRSPRRSNSNRFRSP